MCYAYAFGSSQCGRLLREFVHLGFNTDERDRLVLDGVMAHVAGAARLVINRRWSAPRAVATFDTASYPFTDTAQPDPISGIAEGMQENPRVTHRPKIFYTTQQPSIGTPVTLGAVLKMDPKTETFINDKAANAMLTRKYRKNFEVPSPGKV